MTPRVVLRFTKLKTYSSLVSTSLHISRKRKTVNADPKRLNTNISLIRSDDILSDMNRVLIKNGITKVRKNAVLGVEVLCSASPEYFTNGVVGYENPEYGKNWDKKRLNKWIIETDKWLKEKFGENILISEVHLDESTPHLHMIFIPIVKNRLNCRAILGGRDKLSKLQDGYGEAMKPLGLTRGVKGSTAKHTSVKQYYNRVNQVTKINAKIPAIEPPSRLMSKDEQSKYISKQVKEKLSPLYASARCLEAKVQELENANKDLKKRIRWYEKIGTPKQITCAMTKLKEYINLIVSFNKTIEEKRFAKKADEIRKSFLSPLMKRSSSNVRKQNKHIPKGPTL